MRITLGICVLALLFSSCAQVKSPEGGPRDRQAPQVIESESSENFQTNVKPRSIVLTFDEWVRLASGGQGIVLSPHFERRPRIRLKRKSVIIEFREEDTLRDNTTYLVQLGDEVQDITERNPNENYIFVFSTGSSIDSLTLSGGTSIIGDINPEWERAKAYLFDEWQDTAFVYQVPYYLTNLDSSGRFDFQYLGAGDYRMAIMLDQDKNGVYDRGIDYIGFVKDSIRIPRTGSIDHIPLYQEWLDLYIESIDTSSLLGAHVKMSRSPAQLQIQANTEFELAQNDADITIHYLDSLFPKQFILTDSTIGYSDTFEVKGRERKEAHHAHLDVTKLRESARNIGDSMVIWFEHPVALLDKSLIEFRETGLEQSLGFDINPTSAKLSTQMTLTFGRPLEIDSSYILKLLPGSLIDLLGEGLDDTLSFGFVNRSALEGGDLTVSIAELDSTINYVVELRKASRSRGKQESHYRRLAPGVKKDLLKFQNIPPGEYRIFVSEDSNNDGRWTPGDIDRWRVPEKRYQFNTPTVRENWETDFKIDLK